MTDGMLDRYYEPLMVVGVLMLISVMTGVISLMWIALTR